MSSSPLRQLFAAVRRLQRLGRSTVGGTDQATVTALLGETTAGLAAYEREIGRSIGAALLTAPDLSVSERLEEAERRLAVLRDEVADLRAIFAATPVTEELLALASAILGRRLSGAGVVGERDPFDPGEAGFPRPPNPPPAPSRPAVEPPMPAAPLPTEPAAADLDPLHGETFAPGIVALTGEMDGDPRRLFEAVVSRCRVGLYAGHCRAPAEVLADGVGNDADLAGLLVELLRAAGLPARLVVGNLRIAAREAAAWFDIADPAALAACLGAAGYTVFSSRDDSGPVIDLWDRFRVLARLGGDGAAGGWTELDPSVRRYEVEPGLALWSLLPWTPAVADGNDADGGLEAAYLGRPEATAGPLRFYEEALREALRLAGAPADQELDQSLRRRHPEPVDVFPPDPPYRRLFDRAVLRSFPAELVHGVTLRLTGRGGTPLLETGWSTPGRCRREAILDWVPASAAAHALLADAAGPALAPAFALDLRPRLLLREPSGTLVEVAGTGIEAAGVDLDLQFTVRSGGPVPHHSAAKPACGSAWALACEPPAPHLVERPPHRDLEPTPGIAGRAGLLLPLAARYHARLATAAARVAELSESVAVVGSWLTLAGAPFETLRLMGFPAGRRTAAFQLDVKKVDLRLFASGSGEPLPACEELFWAEGSYQEARVLGDHLGTRPTSTVEALRSAVAQGIALRVLTPAEAARIGELDLPEAARNALRMAAGGGATLLVPERAVPFGARDLAVWIARGGRGGAPSEYRIGLLAGGLADDDDPDDDEPRVTIFRRPAEVQADLGRAVDLGALAYDSLGNDLTRTLQWSAGGGLPGGGAGGRATYTPARFGAFRIVASVPFEASLAPGRGGGAADETWVKATAVAVDRVRLLDPPRLTRVVRPDPEVYQRRLEPLVGDQFEPDGAGVPAVAWAGQRTRVEVEIHVDPLPGPQHPLTVEIEAASPGGLLRVDPLHRVFTFASPIQTFEVPLRVADRIGIADRLEWTFRVGEKRFERRVTTALEVLVTAREPLPHQGHLVEQVVRWSCSVLDGLEAGSTADEDLLDLLLDRRQEAGLSYGAYVGDGYLDLVAYGRAMCAEFADWFLALARAHGIVGERWRLNLDRAEPLDGDHRWMTWLCTARGVNHQGFNTLGFHTTLVIPRGKYRTRFTAEEDATSPDSVGTPFGGRSCWLFGQHFVAVFRIGDRRLLYDPSFDPRDAPDKLDVTDLPQLEGQERIELLRSDPFWSDYLRHGMTVLRGRVWLRRGLLGVHLREVYVFHSDLFDHGEEQLAVRFRPG